jgi:isoquinoline 1-oxidoreductase beta subunit
MEDRHDTGSALNRREFLKALSATAGGLWLGFHWRAHELLAETRDPGAATAGTAIDSWLHLTADGSATVYCAKAEMGQGIHTALPLILADEAELDWGKVSVEFAPSTAPFIDPKSPFTGGSSSVRTGYTNLRTVGAAVRELMIAAAAARWRVPVAACQAREGAVHHGGQRLGYGELAADAAKLPVPASPKLKRDSELRLIGKPHPRLDSRIKVTGRAVFGIDVVVPDMQYGAVRLCPVFGGEVKSVKEPDGHKLARVPGGVVVIASSWWKAKQLADNLTIEFDEGSGAALSSESISRDLGEALKGPGTVAFQVGDADKALAGAAKKLEADYETPFLAHATMEPLACTARVTADGCEIWAPTQSPFFVKITAGKLLGVDPEKVIVHSTFLGGGFGRKAEQDFVTHAVLASKAAGRPVKVIWSRENDLQHDFYRPSYRIHFTGGLDAKGEPIAWASHAAGDSIMSRWFPDRITKGGVDPTSVEGSVEIHYGVPNQKVVYTLKHTGIPVGFWRSVGSSHNAFFVESFIDEMAHAAGRDPYAYRRQLLAGKPRHRAVLEAAAEHSGWGKRLPAGLGRGIALAQSFGSIVAQVAEVEVRAGKIQVHRVTCAVDCGPIVNPATIEVQMQGAIVYGLTAALMGEITIDRGRAVQSNFDDYPVLRLPDMPRIEVHLIPSHADQGGIGEPGVPPIAPAVANALFAITGQRVRSLPFSRHFQPKPA